MHGLADITEYVDLRGKKEIIQSGGHFDIIKAVDVRNNHAVAVKRVRLAGAPDQVIRVSSLTVLSLRHSDRCLSGMWRGRFRHSVYRDMRMFYPSSGSSNAKGVTASP